MATLTETIQTGRERVEALVMERTAKTQLLQTFYAIEGVTTPARDLVSECVTALRDPRSGPLTPKELFVRQRVEAALALLDGEEQS